MFSIGGRINLSINLALFTLIAFYTPCFSEAQQNRASAARQAQKITGTYTSLHFNKQGGDLLGQELKIVTTRKGYQGALQFAEGGAGELIVVNIQIDENKIAFEVPDSYADAGRFTGTIQNGLIRGVFTFKGGGTNELVLKRGKSYWD